jgi:hypothetical protein
VVELDQESGEVRPLIDKRYGLNDVPVAILWKKGLTFAASAFGVLRLA